MYAHQQQVVVCAFASPLLLVVIATSTVCRLEIVVVIIRACGGMCVVGHPTPGAAKQRKRPLVRACVRPPLYRRTLFDWIWMLGGFVLEGRTTYYLAVCCT